MAADKLKSLATRAFGLWRVVRLFRDVGIRGIPATVDHVKNQTVRILDTLDPMTKMLSEMNEPGYADKVLVETTDAAAKAANSAIENTSLVLGHSILDEVLTECCSVSAETAPDDWMSHVLERKIPLSEVLRTPAGDIGRQLLGEFLDQLSRESMRKRADILNRLYQPARPFEYNGQAYRFDRSRMEAIDLHRQRIIHQVELSRADQETEYDDLHYLEATCFYFVHIVAAKHGIAIDPTGDAIDGLRSMQGNPVQLAYEGLLLATSLPTSDEKVWSFGGQIFASDKRISRQLPLLMPAATPDISPDRTKLVFVKYRQKPQGREAEDRRDYVGDIWISAVDGSGAELVLEGGPHPGIRPPVEGFAQELEGITSPKFDPEMRLVYFIADAWTTSGAIYVLDLHSRAVKFFAAGNVFAVLHGQPHRGKVLVNQHRYYGPPNYGSYDDFWLIPPNGEVGDDLGPEFDEALLKLYGPGGRKLAFPHH